MEPRVRRKPIWKPGAFARLWGRIKDELGEIKIGRLAVAVLAIPLVVYVYKEVTRDALVIDPFTVPKRFEEDGLTSEVVANRIGEALRQIEKTTQTRMRKDNLSSLQDEGSTPDVEIPGTKFGLKTAIDIIRAIFEVYPRHVSGDVVLGGKEAEVTVYVTQGRQRGKAGNVKLAADNINLLAQNTAEMILDYVNPYVLAVYRFHLHDYTRTVELVERITQTYSDPTRVAAAYSLWGDVFNDQKMFDEAIAKYRRATEVNPKYSAAYIEWGTALWEQNDYDGAIARYKKATELDPKYAATYNNWGNVLYTLKKYGEACAKYQKATELDPKFTLAYRSWGEALDQQQKYDDAIAKYQKATELDPKNASTYDLWGNLLYKQKKYGEAVGKYQKAVELDPKNAEAYNNWGKALLEMGKYVEAAKQFQKARQCAK